MTGIESISLWQQIDRQSWAFAIRKFKDSGIDMDDLMSEAKVLFLTKNTNENVQQCYMYVTKYLLLFARQRVLRDAGKEILFSKYKAEDANEKGKKNSEDVVYDCWQKRVSEESYYKESLRDEIDKASEIADNATRKAIIHILNGDCENLGEAAEMVGLKGAALSKRLAAIGAKLDPNSPRTRLLGNGRKKDNN
ncbi:MAG: hypothetical protein HYS21_13145 [Deltaproteobacteria bacterium]|nr:hypothetical protein [Deltaproteobacteria bacterium]